MKNIPIPNLPFQVLRKTPYFSEHVVAAFAFEIDAEQYMQVVLDGPNASYRIIEVI